MVTRRRAVVYTWGDGSFGQLGHNAPPTGRSPAPSLVVPVSSRRVACRRVQCGATFTVAAVAAAPRPGAEDACEEDCCCGEGEWEGEAGAGAGTPGGWEAWQWGGDKAVSRAVNLAEVGGGAYKGPPCPVPAPVSGLKVRVQKVSCGATHVLAIEARNHTVWTWGEIEGRPIRPTQIEIPTAVSNVAAGSGFSFVCCEDGTAFSWGSNSHGQLGLGDLKDRTIPQKINIASKVLQIVCGGQHVMLLTDKGDLLSCGWNKYGQLGNGGTADQLTPAPVLLGSTEASLDATGPKFALVACGDCHTIASSPATHPNLQTKVWVWGKKDFIGLSSPSNLLCPTEMTDFNLEINSNNEHVVLLSANGASEGSHSAIVTNLGNLYMFGSNSHGQCGQMSPEVIAKPTKVSSLFITEVSCGWYHTAAIAMQTSIGPIPLTTKGAFRPLSSNTIMYIFSFCDWKTLIKLGLLNRTFRELSCSNSIWQELFQRSKFTWTDQPWEDAELSAPSRAIYQITKINTQAKPTHGIFGSPSLKGTISWKLRYLMTNPQTRQFLSSLAAADNEKERNKTGFLSFASSLFPSRPREAKVLMTGLNSVGKTTYFYKLKLGEITTAHNMCFFVDTLTYKNITFHYTVLSGQERIRPLWRHYYADPWSSLIWMVDAHARERFGESKDVLWEELSEPSLAKLPLLVIANKQDLPNAANAAEIQRALDLQKLSPYRLWTVIEMDNLSNTGLYETLDWLYSHI
ncbi:ADP-ribosylation factor 1 [Pelomyxa schiedti]|nr:ADP-ribosylation factor 1 [Pelomyxa schiedti]